MPFNGSGVFQRVRNWVADATAGVKIRADYHDAEDDGFAAGLTNCIAKDGQTLITQNIPFNSKRITGLADPVNPQDASTKAYADTKVAKTGSSVITGNLTINDAAPYLMLNTVGGPSADNRIYAYKDGKPRWMMALGYGGTEDGSGVGSDFYLYRYTDAGTDPGSGPVLIGSRKTGRLTVAEHPVGPLDIATKGYADDLAAHKVDKAGGVMTGVLETAPGAVLGTVGPVGSITVNGSGVMSFLREGSFGANFGVADTGDFYMGGWSHGASIYKFWTTRDFAALPTGFVTNTRLAIAADFSLTTPGQGPPPSEPYPGAVITGFSWVNSSGIPTVQQFRFRYLQVQIAGAWYTVGYT